MTVSRPLGFQVIAVPSSPAAQKPRPALLRRLFDALFESRERQAQRAVDEYVAGQAHRLTDSVEREIGERMLGDWNFRR